MNQSKKHKAKQYNVARVFVENSSDEFFIVDKTFGGITKAIVCDEETANEFVEKLNSYSALVEALKESKRTLEVAFKCNENDGVIVLIENALKLAEGK